MISDTIMLSVITVCRNAAATIGGTAESVNAQTCRDFEWIVVDGASTDGTLQVLAPYNACIAKLVSEPDQGIYDAMNKGLALARGRWVFFLNADDRFCAHDVIERLRPSLVTESRLVYGNVVLCDSARGFQKRSGRRFQKSDAIRCRFPHHQAAFIERTWLQAQGGFDLRFGLSADVHVLGKALRDAAASRWVDIDVAEFNVGGASSGLAYSLKDLRNQQHAIGAACGCHIGILHGLFLCYYVPKMILLRFIRGSRFERRWRTGRMRRQGF